MHWLLIVILFGQSAPSITKFNVEGSESDCKAFAKMIEVMVVDHLMVAIETQCLPSHKVN